MVQRPAEPMQVKRDRPAVNLFARARPVAPCFDPQRPSLKLAVAQFEIDLRAGRHTIKSVVKRDILAPGRKRSSRIWEDRV